MMLKIRLPQTIVCFCAFQFQSIKIELVKSLRTDPQVGMINILSCLIRASGSEQQTPYESVIVKRTSTVSLSLLMR